MKEVGEWGLDTSGLE